MLVRMAPLIFILLSRSVHELRCTSIPPVRGKCSVSQRNGGCGICFRQQASGPGWWSRCPHARSGQEPAALVASAQGRWKLEQRPAAGAEVGPDVDWFPGHARNYSSHGRQRSSGRGSDPGERRHDRGTACIIAPFPCGGSQVAGCPSAYRLILICQAVGVDVTLPLVHSHGPGRQLGASFAESDLQDRSGRDWRLRSRQLRSRQLSQDVGTALPQVPDQEARHR